MNDDPRNRVIPTPRFGATVTNHFASESNPRRVGYFVRAGRSTGRVNRGPWWEITDGKGDFWQVSPDAWHLRERQDEFPHLTVDRSTELPLSWRSGRVVTGTVVGDLYPLAPDTIARAEALIAAHPLTHMGAWNGCMCGWQGLKSHAAHVVQVLAGAGLLASLAHLDEPRPVDAPAPRPARRTTPFAAPRGPRRFADESRGGDAA